MINRNKQIIQRTFLASALVGCAGLALTGCGGEEAPPAVVRDTTPPPPPPPPAPRVTSIEDLMAQLGIDERVMLPENQAPDNDADRIALLNFFDAMVRGDDKTVSEMIPLTDREQLESMIETGQWAKTTGKAIDMVELRTGQHPLGGPVVLALYTVGFDLQPQMWSYGSDDRGYVFEAVQGPPDILDRISSTDLINAWFKYLETELALADEPDVILEVRKHVVNSEKSNSSASSSSGGGPVAAPPPGGGRRPIPKTPMKPPGPG